MNTTPAQRSEHHLKKVSRVVFKITLLVVTVSGHAKAKSRPFQGHGAKPGAWRLLGERGGEVYPRSRFF